MTELLHDPATHFLGKKDAKKPHVMLADFVDFDKAAATLQVPANIINSSLTDGGAAEAVALAMYLNDHEGDCVAEGTLVAGRDVRAGYRAPYSGPAVRLTLASGKSLTVTPNHAVMTPRGFVRARFLNKGDDVIGTGDDQAARVRFGSYLNETPSPVEQVVATLGRSRRIAASFSVAQLGAVAKSVDFHGDERFINGDVDVVRTDGFLRREVSHSTLRDPHSKREIRGTRQTQRLLHRLRPTLLGDGASRTAPLGLVGRPGERRPLGGRHSGVAQPNLLAHRTPRHSGLGENAREAFAMHSKFERQVGEARTSLIAFDVRSHVGQLLPVVERRPLATRSRFVASREHPGGDGSATDSQLVRDLFERFPGVVHTDCIVDVEWTTLRGHVYDLSTADRWYVGNGVIVHNCTCAGVGNKLRLDSNDAVAVTDDDVQAVYVAVTGEEGAAFDPATGANDNGCAEVDVLDWVTQKGIGGIKILGHAAVNPTNDQQRRIALYLCGALYDGIQLSTDNQSQQIWEPGQAAAGSWGGHATVHADEYTQIPDDLMIGGVPIPQDIPGGFAVAMGTWGSYKPVAGSYIPFAYDELHALLTQQWFDKVKADPVLSQIINVAAVEAYFKTLQPES